MRRMRFVLAGVIALLVQLSCGQRISMPGWVGKTPDTFSVFARGNPLKFITSLSQMPLETQRIYLTIIGEGIKEKLHTNCNIFGGEDQCVTLPQDSSFAKLCPDHELKVDCAYYTDDLAEVNEDPVKELKSLMDKRGVSDLAATCESCFENQRKMWCAQTVPKCGSFSSVVEQTILPAISKVLTAEDEGKPKPSSIAEALPSLQQAMALSLPCREMCEAIVATCGCGQQRTFGELLDNYVAAARKEANKLPHTQNNIPAGFKETMFAELDRRPLCSMFVPANTTGFVGHCSPMALTCKDEARWCHGDSDGNVGPSVVEELIAGQLAKGLFGWADSPSEGLMLDEEEAVQDADKKEVKKLEQNYLVRATSVPDKQRPNEYPESFGKVVLLICGIVMVALAGAAFGKYMGARAVQSELPAERRSHGYVPMAVIEEGDDSEGLLSPEEREDPL